ncbi:hypothetical protein, unlikely [Trypanosoma brucei brucei TREU927]|uniref:Uncharacterized protein n=1 Tax=Trypanosoma brucei brucei (strain 927/4 GUTat10.1) TaxID=185431 RepID=Q38G14_TRYB2|nr:hypothetical protein, unlikely [Trypanosoma brucei brucei TREU927]EAN76256.1 hypothetical protein, unlikely [Trypanosoma brucei brucei TREU927]
MGRSPEKLDIPSHPAQPLVIQTVSHMEGRKRPSKMFPPYRQRGVQFRWKKRGLNRGYINIFQRCAENRK